MSTKTNFLSSITSFFGGTSNPGSHPGGRRKSAFGSGYPSSVRRGPPSALDSDAWSLPYSHAYGQDPNSPTANGLNSPGSSQYPPAPFGRSTSPYGVEAPNGAISTSSVADFNNMHPSASSSTLVPTSQGRSFAGGSGTVASARSATGVIIPSTAYPPLRHTWNRIRGWCEKTYVEVGDTLNWPATEQALNDLEMTIGFTLPSSVRESYLCCDGQELESNQSCQDGLFFGLPLLSLEQVAEEWKFWRAVDEDPNTGANPEVKALMSSCPHKWIRPEYSCRGWIPLITDHSGNYIGVDLSPHPSGGGSPGQVIIFGRDFDTKVVVWRGEGEGGWGRFMQSFAEELENGEIWCLEEPSSGSEDEEDAIGYESYFSGGGAGASRGGGERCGDGAAGFRLTGEYKGWPVLEAWADRSVRCWEEVGLAPGQPLNNYLSDGKAPSVRAVDENGEALDAEGSNRSRRGSSVMEADNGSHPLANVDVDATDGVGALPQVRRSFSEEDPNSLTPTNSGRRISDTLSPPLPDTKASRKQKQREEAANWSTLHGQAPQRRMTRPPPAPAQPLDLPTIDDVRAAHAAALASDGRSHQIKFDQNSSGALGYGYQDAYASTTSIPSTSRSSKVDALELETRLSIDANTSTPASRNAHIVGARGRARGLGLGNDSSIGDSISSFSGLNDVIVDDPLRSARSAPRTSTSTAATSPRGSTDQMGPFPKSPRIGSNATGTSTPETLRGGQDGASCCVADAF
ncbi:hypothetical protein IE53DRAFT_59816 [Violaceomyces palustris]|uniref:Uncharacterized protein n=1 Tax=Violaceomyces palustris TaxID=1673888 RepID=A0ACD0P7S4_9BASI|nr:hypothetical protein IE53DRAFT_59816 [Violaceomyces palustris]